MVNSLIDSLKNHIAEHRDEIVISFLIMNQEHSDSVTIAYEEIVSNNLEYFINDEKLLMLSIPVLHRILTKYQLKNQNRTKASIINFLLTYYTKHRRPSSVLFENIDFSNEHNGFLVQLLSDERYSDFDFHFISTEFNKSAYELHREIIRNESIIKQENDQLKLQIQQISEDFNQKYENLNNQIIQMTEIIRQQRIEIDELKKPHINRTFLNEQYPQGIIAFLNEAVNISAGGNLDYNHPLHNIRFYDNSYFFNYFNGSVPSEENGYIEFDVGPLYTIDLNSYFIQSNLFNPNAEHHPKSWKIKGSNNKENWIQLDSRDDGSVLNGPYKKSHFICQEGNYGNPNNRFRYIRYIQDASCYKNDKYHIYITYFELYGDIYTI